MPSMYFLLIHMLSLPLSPLFFCRTTPHCRCWMSWRSCHHWRWDCNGRQSSWALSRWSWFDCWGDKGRRTCAMWRWKKSYIRWQERNMRLKMPCRQRCVCVYLNGHIHEWVYVRYVRMYACMQLDASACVQVWTVLCVSYYLDTECVWYVSLLHKISPATYVCILQWRQHQSRLHTKQLML